MTWDMIDRMDVTRRTWTAAVKLACVLSAVAVAALVALRLADVPVVAIVVPVAAIGFVSSWVQTGAIRRRAAQPAVLPLPRSGVVG